MHPYILLSVQDEHATLLAAWLQAKSVVEQPQAQPVSDAASSSRHAPVRSSSMQPHLEQVQAAVAQLDHISIAGGPLIPEAIADADGERASDLQLAAAPTEHSSLRRPATAVSEPVECVICIETANVVLQPCGHLCVCLGCTGLLTGSCPMCRREVQSSIILEP